VKPRILVVEDIALNRDLMGQLLEDRYTVEFAVDGEEALEMTASTTYDAILLDVAIPRIDGMEVARRVRERETSGRDKTASRRVAIIAVTAHAMEGDRNRCLDAGCDDYIPKPVDDIELERMLQGFIDRAAREGGVT
jgi:CheY-like chemotaxis protein